MPLEAALGAVDFDPEIVFTAVRDLRRRHSTEAAAGVADDGGAVVVELTASLEGLQVTANLIRYEARDEAAEIVGVGADVAKAAGGAGLFRIGAPEGLFFQTAADFLRVRSQP